MSNIQESIFSAIDTIVQNRIESIKADKTILVTIVNCSNPLTREYKASYSGGYIWVYAQESTAYVTGDSVYVLVPQGDFTQKKIILGKTITGDGDSNVSYMSSMLSDYSLIGKNIISDPKNITDNGEIGLTSYKDACLVTLYDRADWEQNGTGNIPKMLDVDNDSFKIYLEQAEAVLIEAAFRTNLPTSHKKKSSGEYGLSFSLAFKDKDNPDITNIREYVISNSSMEGNPFNYVRDTSQNLVLPIDIENFLYIDKIQAYSRGFVTKNDLNIIEDNPNNIYISNIQIYGLKQISAEGLTLTFPEGAIFKSYDTTEYVTVYADLEIEDVDVTEHTNFLWFKEDSRVTSAESAGYKAEGGIGYKLLDGETASHRFYANDNKAYENKYKCIARYGDESIFKDTFVLNNTASQINAEITSNLGTKFSFDRGNPTLTCNISKKDDNGEDILLNLEDYFFLWSKTDSYDKTIVFNETAADVEEQISKLKQEAEENNTGYDYSTISSLNSRVAELTDVDCIIGENVFTYPVNKIEGKATFKCMIYKREGATSVDNMPYMGFASIILQNEDTALPGDYVVSIINGDQVFQYSESGVSPASARNVDPIVINPLEYKFYDPQGLEVDKSTYTCYWKFPLENTLLVAPAENVVKNEATGLYEYLKADAYKFSIEDNYNYNAINNQIELVVSYAGRTYIGITNFTFSKIGDNGTNGTDMFAKIIPSENKINKELFTNAVATLCVDEGITNATAVWNNLWATDANSSALIDTTTFQLALYQNNNEYSFTQIPTWKISKTTNQKSQVFSAITNGILTYKKDVKSYKYREQIIGAEVTIDNSTYRAFYGVPIIEYVKKQSKNYRISIDYQTLLKSVTYNSAGSSPSYNTNQGVKLITKNINGEIIPVKVSWYAEGGEPLAYNDQLQEYPVQQNGSLFFYDEENNAITELLNQEYLITKDEDGNVLTDGTAFMLVKATEFYSGEYTNNNIHATVYTISGTKIADVYVPVHLQLNTYGLESLNSWDGNSIELNEDSGSILAPQIGAGQKNESNQFTGVVMGVENTWTQSGSTLKKDTNIGLLGYHEGERSIFLDADTGNAIFGLASDAGLTEGRIKLIPKGTSEIGSWKIGKDFLYNCKNEDGTKDVEVIQSGKENYNTGSSINSDTLPQDKNYPSNSKIWFPKTAQGIILSAYPAYLSIKGRPLVGASENSKNYDFNDQLSSSMLKSQDSLELEIDPNKRSIFSIYRHYYEGDGDKKKYYRKALVGINESGQFFTNAIQDGESNMGIGKVGAFKSLAAEGVYIGANFAYNNNTILKFFVPSAGGGKNSDPVYLSGASNYDNEYARPFKIYGKTVDLYSASSGYSTSTTDRVSISTTSSFIGHESAYLSINKSGTTTLKSSGGKIELTSGKGFTLTGGSDTISTDANYNFTLEKVYNISSSCGNAYSVKAKTATHKISSTFTTEVGSRKLTLDTNSSNGVQLIYDDSSYLKMTKDGLNCTIKNPIVFTSNNGYNTTLTLNSGKLEMSCTSSSSSSGKSSITMGEPGNTASGIVVIDTIVSSMVMGSKKARFMSNDNYLDGVSLTGGLNVGNAVEIQGKGNKNYGLYVAEGIQAGKGIYISDKLSSSNYSGYSLVNASSCWIQGGAYISGNLANDTNNTTSYALNVSGKQYISGGLRIAGYAVVPDNGKLVVSSTDGLWVDKNVHSDGIITGKQLYFNSALTVTMSNIKGRNYSLTTRDVSEHITNLGNAIVNLNQNTASSNHSHSFTLSLSGVEFLGSAIKWITVYDEDTGMPVKMTPSSLNVYSVTLGTSASVSGTSSGPK